VVSTPNVCRRLSPLDSHAHPDLATQHMRHMGVDRRQDSGMQSTLTASDLAQAWATSLHTRQNRHGD